MAMFLVAPLGVFLFVLVVLLLAKVTSRRIGGVALGIFGFLACCGAGVLLYLLLAQRVAVQSQPVAAGKVTYLDERQLYAHLDESQLQAALASEVIPASAIPVEETLVAEQAANPPKPGWVDEPKRLVGDDYYVTVVVGPHATRELCDRAMTEELGRATEQYIDQLIGSEGAGRRVQLPLSDVRRQVVQDEYQEPVQASFGPMINLHALLKFDKKMQDRIVLAHEQALVRGRLGLAAGGAGLVMVLLATLFGYLKLDTATRGYYSGRLKVAAAAVILTAVAATVFVARQSTAGVFVVGQRGAASADRF